MSETNVTFKDVKAVTKLLNETGLLEKKLTTVGIKAEKLFDLILAISVLHHTDDFHGSLKKIYELLKIGGRTVIEVPTIYRNIGILKGSTRDDVSPYYTSESRFVFSHDQLLEAVGKYFQICDSWSRSDGIRCNAGEENDYHGVLAKK